MQERRDESFSRQNRLGKSTDFRRIFSKGKRTATRFFVIYSLPNHLPFARLGIQIKAKLGNAPKRNYMKRIVREAFRKMKPDFSSTPDVIFIAEKDMTELNYHQLEAEFRKALARFL